LEGKVTASICGKGDREVREMLLHTVRSLVNYPGDVEIVIVSERENSLFCIETHPEDLNELIGAGGQTARALQTILAASGMKLGRRMILEIVLKGRRPQ
jgi:predicted RNA-binding protein YlqC (UPF0109 family)